MDGGAEAARAPRFPIRDPILVWLGAYLAANVAFIVAFGLSSADIDDDPSWPVIAVALAAQMAATGFGCYLACRVHGTGSLRDDLGLTVRIRDWWLVGAGAVLAIVLGLLLSPLVDLVDEKQSVVEDLQTAGGGELITLTITAAVLAPLLEELLFRGLLLRALLARVEPRTAIAVSAVAFGAVHLVDPSLGTLIVVPALITVGAVAGVLAVRTGDLSRSILLHVGFNLPAVLGALVS